MNFDMIEIEYMDYEKKYKEILNGRKIDKLSVEELSIVNKKYDILSEELSAKIEEKKAEFELMGDKIRNNIKKLRKLNDTTFSNV